MDASTGTNGWSYTELLLVGYFGQRGKAAALLLMRHTGTDDFSTLILSFLRAVVASQLKAELCSPGCLPALI